MQSSTVVKVKDWRKRDGRDFTQFDSALTAEAVGILTTTVASLMIQGGDL
jgi:hypothetical protein